LITIKLPYKSYAPNLIYDDNGMAAVTCGGFHQVVFGDERLEGEFMVIVEKGQWQKTIREAVKYCINN